MHLWLEILAREAAMLATLFAFGIGPASFLGRRFDLAARVAIAPVLGLCLATCVFTTLVWFTAAENTYWLIPVIATVSLGTALRPGLRAGADVPDGRRSRLRARDALSLAIVCMVVAAPLTYTLHERGSVGPTGFLILDADGYTETADAIEQLSIRQAVKPAAESASPIRKYWQVHAASEQNVDASPLAANLDLLLGLHATDTQSLFMIVFLMSGALGAFAVVRYFAPKPSWAAPLAGVLFAGPLFLQLLADGSQAATCGISVIPPLAAVGLEAIRERRLANLFLFALLASGLMALYPLYFPAVAVASALVLIATAMVVRSRDRLTWRSIWRVALQIAIVIALTIALDVVSFLRDVHFWLTTIGGEDLAGKPPYYMAFSVLPGWVLQTQQFYVLQYGHLGAVPILTETSFDKALRGVVLPGIFIVVILFGLWRQRRGLVFISIVVVFAGVAAYASTADQCSYCVDRDTLPSGPLVIVLFVLGVVALATVGRRWTQWLAVVVAVLAVVAVGQQTWTERQLFAADSYFLGGDERKLASELPPKAGPVDLEGFGENAEGDHAVAELALVYSLVFEHNHGEVSLPSEYFNYNSLAYLGGPNPQDPNFDPNYRYVLTRLGGVQTGRRVISRSGPLALEERTDALDATVTSGLGLPMVRQNAEGLGSVVAPLHLLLVGGGTAPAWVRLRFETLAPAAVPAQPGVRAHVSGDEVTACVRATGRAPVRRATLSMTGTLYEGATPRESLALPEPPQGIALVAMQAVSDCTLAG